MRKAALLLELLPLVLAPLCTHAAQAEEPTQVYLSEGELQYVGLLDAGANSRLFALYDSLERKPAVLSIRSRGGPVNHGMALATWLRAHQLDVKVLEFCMSSCANYVFPAGRRKVVSNFAVIGYHGGPGSGKFQFDEATQKMMDALAPEQRKAMMASVVESVKAEGQKEQAYLKSIGVREDLSTLGQQERYQRLYRDDPDTVGWTYSLEDFARLGVRDISVINPPWKPGSAMRKASFVLLKLDD